MSNWNWQDALVNGSIAALTVYVRKLWRDMRKLQEDMRKLRKLGLLNEPVPPKGPFHS